jgi:hypothetical protein
LDYKFFNYVSSLYLALLERFVSFKASCSSAIYPPRPYYVSLASSAFFLCSYSFFASSKAFFLSSSSFYAFAALRLTYSLRFLFSSAFCFLSAAAASAAVAFYLVSS